MHKKIGKSNEILTYILGVNNRKKDNGKHFESVAFFRKNTVSEVISIKHYLNIKKYLTDQVLLEIIR